MLSKVTLNNTDLQVSQLCYGTNMLGWMLDQDASNALLDRFVALGGNFIDTARMYGDWVPDAPAGASERAIGAWLKLRGRENIVVSTKGGAMDMRAGDWRNRVTPEDIAKDLGESLEHLGIATIDLYWLHADNPEAPVGPIIDALLAHQAAGRIRYFGASNWTPARIIEANNYAASKGKQGFVAAEPFWGLALPNLENANAQGYQLHYEGLFEELHASGLPIIPYAGQSGGYFTKVASGGVESVREDVRARYDNPANQGRLAAAKALAEKHGVSINEVVLAYLLNQPYQTIPIIGASRPEQIEESVKAVALKLTPEELSQLRAG
jgi:aryl-alcohol dehydrogenase-like predicted oxidoreductase